MVVVLNLFDIRPERQRDYAEYLRKVQPVLDRHGAEVLVYGETRMLHLGRCVQQYCGLIRYPSMASLKRFSGDPDFLAIRPLRDESTENYLMCSVKEYSSLGEAAKLLGEAAGAGT